MTGLNSARLKLSQMRMNFVLTTRSVDLDVLVLPALLKSESPYIGAIGSRRRWALTREKLIAAGISQELVDSVHSPIGIDLKAETPREIALSIMAEVLMCSKGA